MQRVYAYDNLDAAWHAIRENARSSNSDDVRSDIAEFAQSAPAKLRSMQYRLVRGKFSFGQARGIAVPKKGGRNAGIRPIVLAPVEARIAQRAVLNVLQTVPELKARIANPNSFGALRQEKGIAGVPGAIKAALKAIDGGASFYAKADIRAFFTCIPKPRICHTVREIVKDDEFTDFFEAAIKTELANLAALRETAHQFPIEEIGVAQGNSLSPLAGNIALAKFDLEMNRGDCSTLRYVDDLLILGPSAKAVNAKLREAKRLLAVLGMELSESKSSVVAQTIESGFSFLGIEVKPGLIRPTKDARARILVKVSTEFLRSAKVLRSSKPKLNELRNHSLVATLKRVDNIASGWGKAYSFCNDASAFDAVDAEISRQIGLFIGEYRRAKARIADKHRSALLGVTSLATLPRDPLPYPKKRSSP